MRQIIIVLLEGRLKKWFIKVEDFRKHEFKTIRNEKDE